MKKSGGHFITPGLTFAKGAKQNEHKVSALLACPFCGSDDIEIEETDSGIGGLRGEYYVTCCGCYAETSKENTRHKAKQAWNRRHANNVGEL